MAFATFALEVKHCRRVELCPVFAATARSIPGKLYGDGQRSEDQRGNTEICEGIIFSWVTELRPPHRSDMWRRPEHSKSTRRQLGDISGRCSSIITTDGRVFEL